MTDRPAALDAMLNHVVDDVSVTQHLTGRAALSPQVIRALQEVPRDAFVPTELRTSAYLNTPLPIGHAQTISQPYIVALMTDLLALQADDVVLEIGTGSGYQAAVLSRLVKQVYSVECIEELARQATQRLNRLKYHNVSVRTGDGNAGWPEHAPFDAVIVTAAAPRVPPALVHQLKPGGRLVIPVGMDHCNQELLLIHKNAHGQLTQRSVLPVVFVPLRSGRAVEVG